MATDVTDVLEQVIATVTETVAKTVKRVRKPKTPAGDGQTPQTQPKPRRRKKAQPVEGKPCARCKQFTPERDLREVFEYLGPRRERRLVCDPCRQAKSTYFQATGHVANRQQRREMEQRWVRQVRHDRKWKTPHAA